MNTGISLAQPCETSLIVYGPWHIRMSFLMLIWSIIWMIWGRKRTSWTIKFSPILSNITTPFNVMSIENLPWSRKMEVGIKKDVAPWEHSGPNGKNARSAFSITASPIKISSDKLRNTSLSVMGLSTFLAKLKLAWILVSFWFRITVGFFSKPKASRTTLYSCISWKRKLLSRLTLISTGLIVLLLPDNTQIHNFISMEKTTLMRLLHQFKRLKSPFIWQDGWFLPSSYLKDCPKMSHFSISSKTE